MKKIRKIKKIKLNSKEMKELTGGNTLSPSTGVSKFAIDSLADSGCGCDCAGCIWEDGGGGFSVGMIYANL